LGTDHVDVLVVGAGILGLTTARALIEAEPALRLLVVDKEPGIAAHQSGHNSGVLHSGIYYRPGSEKARLCTNGRELLEQYCADNGVPFERCGKVVVATRTNELDALAELHDRGTRNGLDVIRLDRAGLADHEPHADGLAALFVPATGVVDFKAVCRRLADDLQRAGAAIAFSREATSVRETASEVLVDTTDGVVCADQVVNCAGLQSDLLATRSGARSAIRIVAFRGEYATLVEERNYLVRHLIYPVPDPRFPFLGVHLTRGIDGHVHAGPNAVLALAREGYRWRDVSARDVARLAADRAVWRLGGRYWRTGVHEVTRSLSKKRTLADIQRLVPDIRADDLLTATGSGVRAQAVAADGTLLDDFAIEATPRCVHVLNAPSPAATASLALGRFIASRLHDLRTAAVTRRPTQGGGAHE
jgi:(S)-2-hydroxyglutarate dehydrogenase